MRATGYNLENDEISYYFVLPYDYFLNTISAIALCMPNDPAAIAIIDDDEIFQMLIRKILERGTAMNTILQFFSGSNALTYFKAHTGKINQLPVLIFLDLLMPGMTGWQFLEQFEKLSFAEEYKPTLFILTASSNLDFEELKNYPSVKGYLTKPIVPNEFIGLIQEVMEE